jgi:hypothetical protein
MTSKKESAKLPLLLRYLSIFPNNKSSLTTMMKSSTFFLAAIAVLNTALNPSVAQAVMFIPQPSSFNDTNFNNAKSNTIAPFTQAWQEDWVAEVRGGNNALNGTQELSINNWIDNTTSPGAAQTTPAQNIFTSGQAVNFSVSYNGTNANFLWGTNLGAAQKTLSTSNLTESSRFPQGLDSIFIRLRSNSTSSFQLSNLVVNGQSYSGSMLANNTDNLDYLLITGITNNFTLTGTATLAWTSAAIPSNSNLNMTVKMGYGAVPEPLTIAGSVLAGSGLMFFKRKIRSLGK